MKLSSSDIAGIVNGELIGASDLPVEDIITDSRQSGFSGGLVFIAIKGENHDGHLYIDNMFKSGTRVFIVEKIPPATDRFAGAAFIIVGNTVHALQLLATYKRKNFKYPVIAVTGSAGKTVVKEWLAEILGMTTPVIRSPKSYNSQIGVPLSVWKLDGKYRYGIFEAGISKTGEMDKLQKVIDPDIGVLTNIGDAHSENFSDAGAKTAEKLKLFRNARMLVYSSDNDLVHQILQNDKSFADLKKVSWSFEKKDAAIYVKKISLPGGNTGLQLNYADTEYDFEIPFRDGASVQNAISVACVCLALGTSVEMLRTGMANLQSVAMRMELKNGINGCQLIEDYYNSDPGSLVMAVEYLMQQNNRNTTLILSDFVQSGRDEEELYGEVASLLSRAGIKRFIGIGNSLKRSRELFPENSRFFSSTDDFVNNFSSSDFSNEIILLKGARVYEFEKIGKLLELKVHQTVLEINLDAISHNLNEFRKHLNPETRVMAMVKAFAYGAGSSEIASFLEFHRVSYLAVAYADEGTELRKAGVTLPVMVMNPEPSALDVMIKYNLEPELYSLESITQFCSVASRHGLINYPVHIKIDSGMHRLGFLPEDIEELVRIIETKESIKIVSVFTHLAASENKDLDSFSHKQVDVFQKAVAQIQKATGYSFLRHVLNSSGIARFPQYQFEMVRPGIGLYGVGEFKGLKLKTTSRFKTRISQVKNVKAGEPVGYGCADISESDREIAILPVGYADGLSRMMGNRKGSLYINGTRVPIIGHVCMDMCMVDVTGLNAKSHDEAEIFGDNITIQEIAEKCNTIPYEILTSIPGRVKRVFYRE